MTSADIESVWRHEFPHVLAALRRKFPGQYCCEDAVQEALEVAFTTWPETGIPCTPRGWLIRVASRRVIDDMRREQARTKRERLAAVRDRLDDPATPTEECSTLETLRLCCHPVLPPQTQVILALRVVVGLSTSQIADLFYMSDKTAGQRISRAKGLIRRQGDLPEPSNARERLSSVLQALYLMFTQAHTLSRGAFLRDDQLSSEAIRLTRQLRVSLPNNPEVVGLLALMILTDARREARADPLGNLIPLEIQDRQRWDRAAITEGIELLEQVLPVGYVGPYQVQAAIAAVHSEALTWDSTDWPQILELYRILERIAPSSTVRLNRAVAEAMTLGPEFALAGLAAAVARDDSLRNSHRFHATRGHLHDQAQQHAAALSDYRHARTLCRSDPECAYLDSRIVALAAT